MDGPIDILQLAASSVIGYLLGALPVAQVVSRRLEGVDIYHTGTTLGGTANVFWNVGRRSGLLVFAGDVGKGTAAVAVAWALGVEAPLTLVAAGAAIVGHWASVFSAFKGGDGMTPLIGVSLALVPVLTALAAVVGVATVLLLRHRRLRSAAGICTGYLLMLGLGLAFDLEPLVSGGTETELVVGLTIMAGLVLLRSMIVRRRLDAAERAAAAEQDATGTSRNSGDEPREAAGHVPAVGAQIPGVGPCGEGRSPSATDPGTTRQRGCG